MDRYRGLPDIVCLIHASATDKRGGRAYHFNIDRFFCTGEEERIAVQSYGLDTNKATYTITDGVISLTEMVENYYTDGTDPVYECHLGFMDRYKAILQREKSVWAMQEPDRRDIFLTALKADVIDSVYRSVKHFTGTCTPRELTVTRLWLYVNTLQLAIPFDTDIYSRLGDRYKDIVERDQLVVRLYDVADLVVAKLQELL